MLNGVCDKPLTFFVDICVGQHCLCVDCGIVVSGCDPLGGGLLTTTLWLLAVVRGVVLLSTSLANGI